MLRSSAAGNSAIWKRCLLRPRARRAVANVEWYQRELYPRIGFIVTDLSRPNKQVVKFYNGRSTAQQHIRAKRDPLDAALLVACGAKGTEVVEDKAGDPDRYDTQLSNRRDEGLTR